MGSLTLRLRKYFYINRKEFFQFEIIINVLVSSDSFEYPCYWSTAIINFLISFLMGFYQKKYLNNKQIRWKCTYEAHPYYIYSLDWTNYFLRCQVIELRFLPTQSCVLLLRPTIKKITSICTIWIKTRKFKPESSFRSQIFLFEEHIKRLKTSMYVITSPWS